ncbi:hypothetical protein GCM10020331_058980 [Ectobacillus funiculus]
MQRVKQMLPLYMLIFEFTTDYPKAVQAVRKAGKHIALATPRIHMPGENGIFKWHCQGGPRCYSRKKLRSSTLLY